MSTTRSSSSTIRARTEPATWSTGFRARDRRVGCHPSHNPPGFGFAVRAGLDRFGGDAVAIVMGDGSDSPEDLLTYYRILEEGYDCAFGSRFVRGAHVVDYPRVQARSEPLRQLRDSRALPARLQRHDECVQGVSARGDRDGSAAAVESLQPDRRAPVEGDRARPLLQGRPDLVDEPARRAFPSSS